MGYSTEETAVLEQNPYVRVVTPLTFVMEDTLYELLFEEWLHDKQGKTIREGLCERGIPENLVSEQYVAAVTWNFQGNNGHLHRKNLKNKANDVALIASGLFMTRRNQVAWNPEFKNSLLDHYPEESFEEGILKAGLTPEVLGYQRMANLRHAYKVRTGLEERYCGRDTHEAHTLMQTGSGQPAGNAWQYVGHPYVSGVSGDKSIAMTTVFYNEAVVLEGMSVQAILQLYEIDPAVIGKYCLSELRLKLLKWEKTDATQEVWDEQVLRIQRRRLQMLVYQSEETFARIRSKTKGLRPLQKKELCRQISEYPTRTEHPYGYSLRLILAKAGISKTVYYKALYDEEYGRGDFRHQQDPPVPEAERDQNRGAQ